MPKEVSSDKSIQRVEAAARKASARNSGTAGGSLKGVNFTPGEKEIYNSRRK